MPGPRGPSARAPSRCSTATPGVRATKLRRAAAEVRPLLPLLSSRAPCTGAGHHRPRLQQTQSYSGTDPPPPQHTHVRTHSRMITRTLLRGSTCRGAHAVRVLGLFRRPCVRWCVRRRLKPRISRSLRRVVSAKTRRKGGGCLGGGGGWHDAVVSFSVCSRRRPLADRHLRCPALPFPSLEWASTRAAVVVRRFCFSIGGGLRRPKHEGPLQPCPSPQRGRGNAHGGRGDGCHAGWYGVYEGVRGVRVGWGGQDEDFSQNKTQ